MLGKYEEKSKGEKNGRGMGKGKERLLQGKGMEHKGSRRSEE